MNVLSHHDLLQCVRRLPVQVRDLLDEMAKKNLELANLRLLLARHENEAKKDAVAMLRAALTCRRGKFQVLALRMALADLVRVAHRFCLRVESGEVRSVRTYADFKAALEAPAAKRILEEM